MFPSPIAVTLSLSDLTLLHYSFVQSSSGPMKVSFEHRENLCGCLHVCWRSTTARSKVPSKMSIVLSFSHSVHSFSISTLASLLLMSSSKPYFFSPWNLTVNNLVWFNSPCYLLHRLALYSYQFNCCSPQQVYVPAILVDRFVSFMRDNWIIGLVVNSP